MQLGLKKQLQQHEIKSYKHKIKNHTSKNRKQFAIHKVERRGRVNYGMKKKLREFVSSSG